MPEIASPNSNTTRDGTAFLRSQPLLGKLIAEVNP